MNEKLIKSKNRVQKHGEVFTPNWMVKKMLNIPGIKECCEDIHATFLEPAAGDGNFLQAILERKLDSVVNQFEEKQYKIKSLFALSSIYGIELLGDNLEVARSRMFLYYLDWYEMVFGEKLSNKSDLYKSAQFIVKKNIVHGNTLTKLNPINGEPIIFYEWQKVIGSLTKVMCIPFTFVGILGEEIDLSKEDINNQIDFLNLYDDREPRESSNEKNIKELDIRKLYTLEK